MSDSANIHFFTEELTFQLPNPALLKVWIEKCVKKSERNISHLTYIFCSDAYLHRLNKKHLQHDTLTDVITFDYAQQTPLIVADVYISVERVSKNAKTFKVPFYQELCRVFIHAVLHMVGYDDKTPEQCLKIRNRENDCLNMSVLQQFLSKVDSGTHNKLIY